MDDRNGRDRQRLSLVGESLALTEARHQANDGCEEKHNTQSDGNQVPAMLAWAWRLRRLPVRA